MRYLHFFTRIRTLRFLLSESVASWTLVAALVAQLVCRPYDSPLSNALDATVLAVLYVCFV